MTKIETTLEFFRADQKAENLMIDPARYSVACLDAQLVCMVDVCCDLIGSNSQSPFCLSAEEDSTQFDITGMPTWCNPPYKGATPFVENLEKHLTDEALLLLPLDAVKKWVGKGRWRALRAYSRSASDLFSKPDDDGIISGKRVWYRSGFQDVAVLRLCRDEDEVRLQSGLNLLQQGIDRGQSVQELTLLSAIVQLFEADKEKLRCLAELLGPALPDSAFDHEEADSTVASLMEAQGPHADSNVDVETAESVGGFAGAGQQITSTYQDSFQDPRAKQAAATKN